MTVQQWNEWLQTVPNEAVEGFEEQAQAWACNYARESGDAMSEICLLSFYGDNPYEWLQEAFDTITSDCKSVEAASELLKNLFKDVFQLQHVVHKGNVLHGSQKTDDKKE